MTPAKIIPQVQTYFRKINSLLDSLDEKKITQAVQIILKAYQKNKQIFIIGNGGSASTSSHFACDLSKGLLGHKGKRRVKRARVISLTDNIALLTAWGNDTSYANIFVEQLKNLLNQGDVLVGISASGNSENVVQAIEYAKKKRLKTIGLLGFDGGRLKKIVDCAIIAPETHYGRVEDIHLVLSHLISELISKNASRTSNKEVKKQC